MKKIYIIVFTILCSFLFVGNVRGKDYLDVKCQYEWEMAEGVTVTFVLSNSDPEQNYIFTKVNSSGLPSTATVYLGKNDAFAYKTAPRFRQESDKCPVISVYHGSIIEIWGSQKSCKSDKEGFSLGDPKKCSSEIPGKFASSLQSAENIAGENQFRLEKEEKNQCTYITESVKNFRKSSYTLTIKNNNGKLKKGNCSAKESYFKCKFSKIESKVEKNFYPNNNFACPSYIYTKSTYTGKEADMINFTLIGTGTEYDQDNSVLDENTNTTHSKGYISDEWIEDTTDTPTAEECKANPNTPGCAKGRCEVIDPNGELFTILKEIIGYAQIGSIFVVIILSILDLGGAIASSDDDAFRKARGKVGKRIIALILIFLVPLLINFVINLVNLGACKEEDYDFIGNLFN